MWPTSSVSHILLQIILQFDLLRHAGGQTEKREREKKIIFITKKVPCRFMVLVELWLKTEKQKKKRKNFSLTKEHSVVQLFYMQCVIK